MRKQVISFTLEPELEEYLRRMAELAHVSISQYLRDLLWSGYEVEQAVKEDSKTVDETIDKWISEGKVKRLPDGRLVF